MALLTIAADNPVACVLVRHDEVSLGFARLRTLLNPCNHTEQNAYCNNICRDASHTGS
jgi:hypothetical protein